jgi:hypothetical protein
LEGYGKMADTKIRIRKDVLDLLEFLSTNCDVQGDVEVYITPNPKAIARVIHRLNSQYDGYLKLYPKLAGAIFRTLMLKNLNKIVIARIY